MKMKFKETINELKIMKENNYKNFLHPKKHEYSRFCNDDPIINVMKKANELKNCYESIKYTISVSLIKKIKLNYTNSFTAIINKYCRKIRKIKRLKSQDQPDVFVSIENTNANELQEKMSYLKMELEKAKTEITRKNNYTNHLLSIKEEFRMKLKEAENDNKELIDEYERLQQEYLLIII